MKVRGGKVGNLWPLTLVLSVILSAPFVFAAFAGTKWRDAGTRSGERAG